ncbi:MAG: aldehyde dehydrogenase family protein, partial [Chloroflexota bacterium]|nr:aldehyde dehydrogenase family protein [Chloroflexota bacterium]
MSDIDAPEARPFGNYIDGTWRPAHSGSTFESLDPSDSHVVGSFAASDGADVAEAVAAARAAFPAWRATPAPRRGEIMYRFAALLAEHKERVSVAMTSEMGKVIAEARGDVQEGIDIAYLMAGEGRRLFGDTVPSELPDKWAMSVREPLGVAGLITPWNFPIAIPCWKMMPALIAGNTVVFKPASDTPRCAVLLVEILAEAGFPPGVINLVTGAGTEVGMPIVEHPDVDVIGFTGNGETGRTIAIAAAERGVKLSMELGGKNAIVVLDDADVDLAVDGIIWSAFGTTGQRCTACSRVIATEGIADELVARLAQRAEVLELGSGLEGADVGPLINEPAVEKVERYVGIGRDEGATLVTGGSRATEGGLSRGHFFEPTIFDGVGADSRLGQE